MGKKVNEFGEYYEKEREFVSDNINPEHAGIEGSEAWNLLDYSLTEALNQEGFIHWWDEYRKDYLS